MSVGYAALLVRAGRHMRPWRGLDVEIYTIHTCRNAPVRMYIDAYITCIRASSRGLRRHRACKQERRVTAVVVVLRLYLLSCNAVTVFVSFSCLRSREDVHRSSYHDYTLYVALFVARFWLHVWLLYNLPSRAFDCVLSEEGGNIYAPIHCDGAGGA